jgi:hypothetical protein
VGAPWTGATIAAGDVIFNEVGRDLFGDWDYIELLVLKAGADLDGFVSSIWRMDSVTFFFGLWSLAGFPFRELVVAVGCPGWFCKNLKN